VVQLPQVAESKEQLNWWQNEYFKLHETDFLLSTYFKLLSQVEVNSLNGW
jgi:hypothetical protein